MDAINKLNFKCAVKAMTVVVMTVNQVVEL